jgi:hypothetical protein
MKDILMDLLQLFSNKLVDLQVWGRKRLKDPSRELLKTQVGFGKCPATRN